jgi:SAM-dependent methyltransferase
VAPELAVDDFRCDADALLPALVGTPSPSRALSDLFWMSLPWSRLEREFGTLRVFDIGCGSGAFGSRLRGWSGNRIERYIGMDVRPNSGWATLEQQEPGFRFVAGDAENLGPALPRDINVIVSQSALEHVPGDDRCFAALREFTETPSRPTVQVHLIPSQACLRLYRLHGFRQYTPRLLSPVARAFGGFSTCRLFRLGGSACNALHLGWITNVDRRSQDPQAYRAALAEAVKHDMRTPQLSPAFYALTIHSYPKEPLFARS